MIFILAGTHEQAQHLARTHDFERAQWRYVSTLDTLRGHRQQVLWLFGTWRTRSDAHECIAMANAMDFRLFTIEDDRYIGDDWK